MRLVLVFITFLLPSAVCAAPSQSPLDALFAQLAKAQSSEEAKLIEDRIDLIFQQSGSASIDLLMTRVTQALGADDDPTAIKLLGAVTRIAPGYAEGWHREGELQSAAGDDAGAMVALQKAITLNPRQFTALSELASMLEQYGDKAGALKLYRRALALDPQMEGIVRHVQALAHDVEGQGI